MKIIILISRFALIVSMLITIVAMHNISKSMDKFSKRQAAWFEQMRQRQRQTDSLISVLERR